MEFIDFKVENGVLTIYLINKLDTTNVNEVTESINEIVSSNEYSSLVLDIENLVYLSSAGLREVLKLKKNNKDFKVINASLEVYDIFEMTGFTDIMDIEKAFRKFDVSGLKVVGAGAKGTVYRFNEDTVIKVYNDLNSLDSIYRERELARKAFVLGVPTAISYDVVKVEDKFGSIFELLESRNLADAIKENPDNMDNYVSIFAGLFKEIHTNTMKDSEVPYAKDLINKWLNNVKPELGEELYNRYEKLIGSIKEEKTLLHMDFHTNNVLMQKDEALLIDMDTLSMGNIIYDFANVYVPYYGFSYISDSLIENFIKMDIDTCKKFYDIFIKDYFGTEDVTLIKDKIELLGLLRVMNHITKRKDSMLDFNEVKGRILVRINELNYIEDLNL